MDQDGELCGVRRVYLDRQSGQRLPAVRGVAESATQGTLKLGIPWFRWVRFRKINKLHRKEYRRQPACNATQPAVATRQRCGRVRSIAGRSSEQIDITCFSLNN